jgi:hypothetical protein
MPDAQKLLIKVMRTLHSILLSSSLYNPSKQRTFTIDLLLGIVTFKDLGEVGWGDMDWIALAQDRNRWRALVNSVLNLWVP